MESKPLFGVLPARTSDCINALVKFAAVSGQICDPEVIKQHCLRLLSGQYTMIYTEHLSIWLLDCMNALVKFFIVSNQIYMY